MDSMSGGLDRFCPVFLLFWICIHIGGSEDREGLVVSLTQVRVPTSMPLAAAVADYHNHRVKKLKERQRDLK